MKLSKNFSSEEITKTVPYEALLSVQQHMIMHIAQAILQPIRTVLQTPLFITSGLRTSADYQRLITKGYFPSETSDHFYGAPVPVLNATKKKKFGSLYCYSVGAVDFTTRIPNDEVFRIVKDMCVKGHIEVGQLIHEYGSSTTGWIHISNPPALIYSSKFVGQFLQKNKFLISADAGKTYTIA